MLLAGVLSPPAGDRQVARQGMCGPCGECGSPTRSGVGRDSAVIQRVALTLDMTPLYVAGYVGVALLLTVSVLAIAIAATPAAMTQRRQQHVAGSHRWGKVPTLKPAREEGAEQAFRTDSSVRAPRAGASRWFRCRSRGGKASSDRCLFRRRSRPELFGLCALQSAGTPNIYRRLTCRQYPHNPPGFSVPSCTSRSGPGTTPDPSHNRFPRRGLRKPPP